MKQGMTQKIRFAVVGASGIAPAHIAALQRHPKVEVACVYSRDFERAKKLASHFGLVPAKTYEDILNNNYITAVDIVTEPARHGKLALDAIRNAKHVLIEKPIDTDLSTAREVVIEASKVLTFTSVISQKRFEPAIMNMKKKIEGGVIGKPFMAEAKLIWKRTGEYYQKGNGWRGKYGNVLMNQAIHWLDIAFWFFGVPESVHAITRKVRESISCYDTAIVTLAFPGDVVFNLICSTSTNESQPEEFNIYGTKGMLEYRQKIRFMSKLQSLGRRVSYLTPAKRAFARSPLEAQIHDFVELIINKKGSMVSVAEAYDVLKILKSCEANESVIMSFQKS